MDDIQVDAKYNDNLDDKIAKAEEILAKGSFRFKKWIKSGHDGEKELGKETVIDKSLGLYWKTKEDKLVFRIKLNFSKKSRNRYEGN